MPPSPDPALLPLLFDRLMENLPDHIYFKDRDGRFTFISASLARHFGLASPHEAVGKSDFDFFAPEIARQKDADEREILRTGRGFVEKEEFSPTPGGEPRWVLTTKLPLHGAAGAIIGTFGISHDFSETKQAREAVLEKNRLLATLVDILPCGIFVKDREGRYLLTNHTFRSTIGRPEPTDVHGHRFQDLYQEPEAQAHFSDDQALLQEDVPLVHREAQLKFDQGREGWALISKVPLRDEAGQVQGIVGMAADITERKRTEALLRGKNDELKTFAYTVSHDLKAPLRGISGYAQELERKHKAGLGERAQYCISQIITAARNLDHLIEDLLRYSRLDAETPNSMPCDVGELVANLLRDRAHTLHELGVQLQVELPPIRLQVWERGLHQVLANLVDNAIKYSRQSTPPRVAITARWEPGRCVLCVTDNGIGFDMKYHDRIFGLFNRLVRANQYEGTGAGLAIVKKLVEKLHGTIRAESAPGQGATFILTLPH